MTENRVGLCNYKQKIWSWDLRFVNWTSMAKTDNKIKYWKSAVRNGTTWRNDWKVELYVARNSIYMTGRYRVVDAAGSSGQGPVISGRRRRPAVPGRRLAAESKVSIRLLNLVQVKPLSLFLSWNELWAWQLTK
jgi:hypothetical protein